MALLGFLLFFAVDRVQKPVPGINALLAFIYFPIPYLIF